MTSPAQIRVSEPDIDALAAAKGAIAILVGPEGELDTMARRANKLSRGAVERVAASDSWGKADEGEVVSLAWPAGMAAERLVVVKLGRKAEADLARKTGVAIAQAAGSGGLTLCLGRLKHACEVMLGAVLRRYDYIDQKSKSDSDGPGEILAMVAKADEVDVSDLTAQAEGVFFCRDLVNAPANVLTTTAQQLDGEFQLGSFWHRLLIGADYDRFKNYQDFRRVRPAGLASNPSDEQSYAVDIDNPVYGRFPLPTPLPNNDRLDIQESIGVFLQDQVELTERLQLRLGARYDDYELRTENYITDIDSERQEGRLSPQLGVVYELSEPVVLYANYGEGFRANIGTDVNGNIFDPEETRAVEAGAKLALFDGAIDATVAVFSQEKKNVLASDINNPGFSAAIGKARSRGVELDVSGELPAEVEFRLSYAYTDAEARSSVLDPNFSFEIKPGDPLANIPDHQFNAQAQKRFTVADKQTMAGAGLRYVSERLGATGTDFTLPDYTLFRLFGDVQLTDNLAVFANIDNVFNTHWYASSYSQLWVQPGTPRTATVGLRATF